VSRLIALLAFCVLCAGCKIEFKTPEKELRTVLDGQLSALNAEEMEKVMSYTWEDAPMFDQQFDILQRIKQLYDLKTSLVSCEYLGSSKDGTFAVILMKQKTEKVSGPEFKNNVVTTAVTFKKVSGAWKMWQSVTFAIDYVD
jgi:hypothetical protein